MSQRRILNSWKEISQYTGRGVRTLQRYEIQFGFPVRRVAEKVRVSVLALTDEVDEWFLQTHRSLPRPRMQVGSSATILNSRVAEPSASSRPITDSSIFVIEDDTAHIDEIRSMLCDLGEYEVRIFRDSTKALAALEEVIEGESPKPKLLVLDYELHDGTGFDLLAQYRTSNLRNSIPLVIWTVLDNFTTKEMSIWMGATAFVPKQLGTSALKHALLPLLRPSQIEDQVRS